MAKEVTVAHLDRYSITKILKLENRMENNIIIVCLDTNNKNKLFWYQITLTTNIK